MSAKKITSLAVIISLLHQNFSFAMWEQDEDNTKKVIVLQRSSSPKLTTSSTIDQKPHEGTPLLGDKKAQKKIIEISNPLPLATVTAQQKSNPTPSIVGSQGILELEASPPKSSASLGSELSLTLDKDSPNSTPSSGSASPTKLTNSDETISPHLSSTSSNTSPQSGSSPEKSPHKQVGTAVDQQNMHEEDQRKEGDNSPSSSSTTSLSGSNSDEDSKEKDKEESPLQDPTLTIVAVSDNHEGLASLENEDVEEEPESEEQSNLVPNEEQPKVSCWKRPFLPKPRQYTLRELLIQMEEGALSSTQALILNEDEELSAQRASIFPFTLSPPDRALLKRFSYQDGKSTWAQWAGEALGVTIGGVYGYAMSPVYTLLLPTNMKVRYLS